MKEKVTAIVLAAGKPNAFKNTKAIYDSLRPAGYHLCFRSI